MREVRESRRAGWNRLRVIRARIGEDFYTQDGWEIVTVTLDSPAGQDCTIVVREILRDGPRG